MSSDVTLESETIQHGNETYRVRVVHDDMAGMHESPRDWCSVGTMVTYHRRHNLPCEGDLTSEIDQGLQDYSFRTVERWLRVFHGATVVLPIWGYDHGQLALKAGSRTYPFSDSWDSGLAGLIYDTPEGRETTGCPADKIEEALTQEVSLYDQWARGEVYGYIIERQTELPDIDDNGIGRADDDGVWQELDEGGACWDFYGVETAMYEGKAELNALLGRTEVKA